MLGMEFVRPLPKKLAVTYDTVHLIGCFGNEKKHLKI